MLEKIKLVRFKKFESTEIELKPFTVFMGENSSGKTSVLQGINLALHLFSKNNYINWNNEKGASIRNKGIGLSDVPGIPLSDFRDIYYNKISRGSLNKKLGDGSIGATISLVDSNKNNYRLQISSLFGTFNFKCISQKEDFNSQPELQDYEPLYISGFVGLLPTEERAFPMALQNRLETGRISTIIRNLLLDTKLNVPTNYKKLQERMKKDFNFDINEPYFNEKSDLYITSTYNETISENQVDFDFNSSGSGFMQILQILAPIYRFCPHKCKIVLLDEPDAHLHPNLQVTLANALQEIQKELSIQIIISTHSTSIIRQSSALEIVPITSKKSYLKPLVNSIEVENEIQNSIDSYDLGKTILSGKLVFLEDSDISILKYFDKILGTNCFNGSKTVPYLTGRGKDDKVPFQLSPILNKYSTSPIEIHFVKDCDGLIKFWREAQISFGKEKGVIVHILKRYEIENYLLEPDIIYNSLFKKNINKKIPTEDEIKLKLYNTLKESIQLRSYNYEDTLEDNIYKTSLMLSLSEYRNPQKAKSESKEILNTYEQYDNFNQLQEIGMGKEVLRKFLKWINEDKKLILSKKDIIENFSVEKIPEEIKEILNNLISNG